MEAMAAGEAGKVLGAPVESAPGTVSEMKADDEGRGGITV